MKIFTRYKFEIIYLLIFPILIIGCSNDKSEIQLENLSENVEIFVSQVVEQSIQTYASNVAGKMNHSTNAFQEDFDNFSWELSATSDENMVSSRNNLNLPKGKYAATKKMLMGKRFRILFYEINNGNEVYVQNAEVTVSSQRHVLKLHAGKTYKWYAYSYDDINTVPMPIDVNSPEIVSRTDSPLLYDSGTCTTGNVDGTRVDVAFEHQVSKVEVRVDGFEVYANNFVSLIGKFNNLQVTTKGFNLKQGSLNSTVLNTSTINSAINFVDDGSSSVKKSANIIYTASLNSIPVTFSNITINKSGTSIVLVSTSSPRNANITGFTADATKLKRAAIKLKYKGAVIDGKEWAQGILYYDPTDIANPYKISEPFMSGTVHPCNYYWNFNTLLPKSSTGTSLSPAGDPCREVLPKNSWRTPTTTDFKSLNEAIKNSPENGAVYFQANNGERVYFHEAGWITGSNCSVANDNDGLYWSSNQESNTKGYVLEIDERGGVGAGNEVTDYPKTYGLTVKCIRTVAP